MPDDALQPLLLAPGKHRRVCIDPHMPAPLLRAGHQVHSHLGQIDTKGRSRQRTTFSQLQHQLLHAFQRVFHRHQHIGLKFGVVLQTLGVFHHQGQLRNNVFQVVHHKRRHAREGFKLSRFQQGFCRLHLCQQTGSLVPCSLEQVGDLPIHLDGRGRSDQKHKPEQGLALPERNDQPGVRNLHQPQRQLQVGIKSRVSAKFVQIDHPVRTAHEHRQRTVLVFRFCNACQIPPRHLPVMPLFLAHQPKCTGRAFKHGSQTAHHAQSGFLRVCITGQRGGEFQPFLSVIKAVMEKMLV